MSGVPTAEGTRDEGPLDPHRIAAFLEDCPQASGRAGVQRGSSSPRSIPKRSAMR
jgi:hypothetical protein